MMKVGARQEIGNDSLGVVPEVLRKSIARWTGDGAADGFQRNKIGYREASPGLPEIRFYLKILTKKGTGYFSRCLFLSKAGRPGRHLNSQLCNNSGMRTTRNFWTAICKSAPI